MDKITQPIVVCALYRFVRLDDFRDLRDPLVTVMEKHGVSGTLLLAGEGINGTVAGTRAAIDALLAWLQRDARMAGLEYKESVTDRPPFKRSRVKLKKEIVTMGVADIDPNPVAGTSCQSVRLERPDQRPGRTSGGYPQRLRGPRRHLPQRHQPGYCHVPRISGLRARTARPARVTPGWRCSAPVASAARSPPPT